MRKSNVAIAVLLAFGGLWLAGGAAGVAWLDNVALMSTVAGVLILVVLYMRFEEEQHDTRQLAAIGTLAALSVAGRCLFAAIPSLQPSTFIVIISGYALGPLAGFMVGATTALVSNIFLGHGPWTIWQMLAWGLAGFTSGLLGRGHLMESRWTLAAWSAAWGFIFGWLMNVWFVLGFVKPVTFHALLVAGAASAWFDAVHAIGNVVFALALGPALIAMLSRYRERFTFERFSSGVRSKNLSPGSDAAEKGITP